MSNRIIRCPNCNYILVLLQNRRKYKCSKCSGLFPQKEIEDREFQKYNKQQREEEMKEIHPRMDAQRRFRKRDPEKIRKYHREYYYKHKEKLLEKKKEYRQRTKQQFYEWRRNYRNNNRDRIRLLTRISFWRQKQKILVLERFNLNEFNI